MDDPLTLTESTKVSKKDVHVWCIRCAVAYGRHQPGQMNQKEISTGTAHKEAYSNGNGPQELLQPVLHGGGGGIAANTFFRFKPPYINFREQSHSKIAPLGH